MYQWELFWYEKILNYGVVPLCIIILVLLFVTGLKEKEKMLKRVL